MKKEKSILVNIEDEGVGFKSQQSARIEKIPRGFDMFSIWERMGYLGQR